MTMLSRQAFQQARSYVFTHGRGLEQQLFAYHFEKGSAADVLRELVRYQNQDGGFGHGLEADVRTAASSAVATQMAFNVLRTVQATSTDPIVRAAIQYLVNTLDAASLVWPIVPPEVEDAPHAPWWNYADVARNFDGFVVNPRAALVGFLHEYAALLSDAFLVMMRTALLDHLSAHPEPLDMHDLFCCLTLVASPNLPSEAAAQVRARILDDAPRVIVTDGGQWGGYGMMPLDAAPSPDALLADLVPRAAVDANLDSLIETQLADGSWPIPWSWGDLHPTAWAEAERDWKGQRVVNNLRVLAAYDRIEAV